MIPSINNTDNICYTECAQEINTKVLFFLYIISFLYLLISACSKGVQGLGSVKHLETILLFWRYINKIELN